MIRAAEQRGIDWRAIYAGRGRRRVPGRGRRRHPAGSRRADDEHGRLRLSMNCWPAQGRRRPFTCGPPGCRSFARNPINHADAPALRAIRLPGRRLSTEFRRAEPHGRGECPSSGEPVGAGRHARLGPDDGILLPAGLADLQGESPARSTAAPSSKAITRCWFVCCGPVERSGGYRRA